LEAAAGSWAEPAKGDKSGGRIGRPLLAQGSPLVGRKPANEPLIVHCFAGALVGAGQVQLAGRAAFVGLTRVCRITVIMLINWLALVEFGAQGGGSLVAQL